MQDSFIFDSKFSGITDSGMQEETWEAYRKASVNLVWR